MRDDRLIGRLPASASGAVDALRGVSVGPRPDLWVPKTRSHHATLWVPETLHTSCDLLIFVDQAAEPVAAPDVVDLGCRALGEWS